MLKRSNGKLVILLVLVCSSFVFAVEKPTSSQATCVIGECHGDYSENAYVHGPVGLGDCKACHKALDPGKHTFQFIREGKDMCEYCHLEQTAKKNVHEPLKGKGDCLQCHDAHSSENQFLLPSESVGELCENCHQEMDADAAYVHGPVAVGECSMCHNPHSSDEDKLLTAQVDELCFSCHTITRDELKKFEFVHEPAKNDCLGCHSGHKADNSNLLKDKAPQLCYSCHEDIKNTAETSSHKHSAVTTEDGCMHCHTAHASTIEFGLKDTPMKLCMSCHDKPIGGTRDEVLKAFTGEIKDKKFLHGPVGQEDCKGCHAVHGSENFRLLSEKYPPEFYAPFQKENYELCFSCHEETLVLTKETMELTDFRNGNQNLHYLHVNKPYRGRTCRSCHATHGSNLPKHIRASVPYGMWDLPVKFTKTETGGSCKSGCHLPFAYDRTKPVDYAEAKKKVLKNKPVEQAVPAAAVK